MRRAAELNSCANDKSYISHSIILNNAFQKHSTQRIKLWNCLSLKYVMIDCSIPLLIICNKEFLCCQNHTSNHIHCYMRYFPFLTIVIQQSYNKSSKILIYRIFEYWQWHIIPIMNPVLPQLIRSYWLFLNVVLLVLMVRTIIFVCFNSFQKCSWKILLRVFIWAKNSHIAEFVVTRNKPYLAKLDTHKPVPFYNVFGCCFHVCLSCLAANPLCSTLVSITDETFAYLLVGKLLGILV